MLDRGGGWGFFKHSKEMHNSTQNPKTQNNSIFSVIFESSFFELDRQDSNSTRLETEPSNSNFSSLNYSKNLKKLKFFKLLRDF